MLTAFCGCVPKINPRGKTLEEYLLRIGVNLLNKGCQPTFTNKRSATITDITFTDPSILDICFNWILHDTPSLSEHAAIRVDINLKTPTVPTVRVWKKADWPLFKSLFQDWPELPTLWKENTIETQCNILHN